MGYLVSRAQENKIPTATAYRPTYVVSDDLFNGNNINIARCCRHNGNSIYCKSIFQDDESEIYFQFCTQRSLRSKSKMMLDDDATRC